MVRATELVPTSLWHRTSYPTGGFHTSTGHTPMSDNSRDEAVTTSVEQLKALGLSTYAARTYVALVRLGEGTAKDVHSVSDVPRTRVYDAVEELQDGGLVDVQHSSPKRFWPISVETTARHFKEEYDYRIDTLTDALDALSTKERSNEQRGVWTVTGREAVTERVADFVRTADDEIVYMTVEDLRSGEIIESLATASDRGVTIKLAEMADITEERLQEDLPEAEVFESIWNWDDTPAGRLLMVDQEKTLVSVLVEGDGDHPPELRDETAIWGAGPKNSLVVVLKTMFTWQLDGARK